MRLDERMKTLDCSQERENVESRSVFLTLLLGRVETQAIKGLQHHDTYYDKVGFTSGWEQEF